MDAFLAQIQLFAFPFAPKCWIACEGQLLPIARFQAVYALIGTTYGGDGTTTFAVPDLRGKAPLPGLQFCLCLEGIFPSQP